MDSLKKGIFLTCILTLLTIVIFFGDIIKDSNNYYFAEGGDGFKSYYGAMYHLKYDSSYFHFQGMNYPYGESVFFTDNQPLLTNSLKWLSAYIVDIREHVVGIINLSMIFSILIAALFLFLIFYELGVVWWFGTLAALGITLLSPQIARMGGHFSLSHVFWIPIMLYLILRYERNPGWKFTSLIAIVFLLAASMHLYFAGFYGLLLSVFWLFRKNWLRAGWQQVGLAVLHWFVQVMLPVVLFELIMVSSDQIADRTSHPYGFLVYLAHPASVFLPSGAPYQFVPKFITVFRHLSWESYSFIGVTALVGSMTTLGYFFIRLFKGRFTLKVTNQKVINLFFWASLLGLGLSFGVPFKQGLESWVEYIGPFRQLRALSRFSWLFYYVINLVVFYKLFHWFKLNPKQPIRLVTTILAFGFLLFEGYYNVRNTSLRIKNRKPLLEDVNNKLAQNQWVNQMDLSNFQAIIPIPYFHVGSENIWIEPKSNVLETTLIASLKTGLPTTAVMMGRTSLSQTYKNYELFLEPLGRCEILDEFRDGKDLLLLRMKDYQPNDREKRIIRLAEPMIENNRFAFFRLPVGGLEELADKYNREVIGAFKPEELVLKNNLYLNDTTFAFQYRSYDDQVDVSGFFGNGALKLQPIKWNKLFDGQLEKARENENYTISFWLEDYRKDAYPRFNIELLQQDNEGKTVDYFYDDIHRYMKAIKGKWAMYEIPFQIKRDSVFLEISIRNKVLNKAEYVVDEMMIRNSNVDVYQKSSDKLFKNTMPFIVD